MGTYRMKVDNFDYCAAMKDESEDKMCKYLGEGGTIPFVNDLAS